MAAPEIDSADGINIGNVLIHAGNVDGRDVSVDGTKLDGVDSGADVTGTNAPQIHGDSCHTDRTRKLWAGATSYHSGEATMYGIALDSTVDEHATYSLHIPNDYVSAARIYMYYASTVSSGGNVFNIQSWYGKEDDAQNVHGYFNAITLTPNSTDRKRHLVTEHLLEDADVGDIIIIEVTRDANHSHDTSTGDTVINGLMLEYTADM